MTTHTQNPTSTPITIRHELRVQGMTCGHCEQVLAHAVGSLDDIIDVVVDAVAGTIDLRCTAPLDLDTVAAAVYDAGYDLVR